jgi:hypothetical protein
MGINSTIIETQTPPNHSSSLAHPTVIDDYINKERAHRAVRRTVYGIRPYADGYYTAAFPAVTRTVLERYGGSYGTVRYRITAIQPSNLTASRYSAISGFLWRWGRPGDVDEHPSLLGCNLPCKGCNDTLFYS